MDNSFSFLIHSVADKPLLKPIIRKLIDAGVRLWIDDPYDPALGLTKADRARLAGYIALGGQWPVQRDDALHHASSYLLIISDESIRPHHVEFRKEASIAAFREHATGTSVFRIALSERALKRAPDLVADRQTYRLLPARRDDGWTLGDRASNEIELLIELLRAEQSQVRDAPPTAEHDQKRAETAQANKLEEMVYFVDRSDQSIEILDRLRAWDDRVAEPLLLPILLGTFDDRPDKFAFDQLPKRVLPRTFRHSDCYALPALSWPSLGHFGADRAVELLVNEILAVDPLPRAAVFLAHPSAPDISTREGLEACLHIWCRTWSHIRQTGVHSALVPVLDIRSNFIRRSPLAMLRSQHASAVAAVKSVCKVVNAKYEQITLAPLVPLGAVSWNCVETWLREEILAAVPSGTVDKMRDELEVLFDKSGMTMDSWGKAARRIVAGFESR